MVNVYLLLGSNLGNRLLYLQEAARQINEHAGQVVTQSAVYETQSWGNTTVPDYLNQVLLIQTHLLPHHLLQVLLKIELQLGRERQEKWGARTMDIDILFYDSDIIEDVDLTVPHPELHNRRFTLAPLAEIAPDFVHPVLNKTISLLKFELHDDLQVKKYIFE
ncbi:2-amino-4-hydroxy-6-hydroxymethyldihydropteridinediphosphokinase [Mucilaginibacter galii]|uniref:2-amino-4-hydroxy-6-hydroxymethyldihydropteridine pyrophosphokinase n=1 Tax=Mucilaginibacter galii TaxID=2005073 RepID=A0A917J6Y6_9SPHI|nr:2-amino-4-hydroxy-6-hydroxymethyldihydropteridine diphosphokinase [Mucilaginibacter galii]GGI50213.1 2-amino-4-hydroxy-6-hydroxymethyldihydropteridine diphosphokinase [Mucilaginibacter galii]